MEFVLYLGVSYLVLSMLLLIGFPPIYRKFATVRERELIRIIPFIFAIALVLVLFVVTKSAVFMALAGVVAICGALQIRGSIAQEAGPPALVPISLIALGRMTAFDIWTLGGGLLFALIAG